MVRKPPDILITTPESLHLMLTSRAREILRAVSHVIVDEIHAVCPNKRGVFLALLLERLEAINPASFVRIGLSATQRPLDEVARYLGGLSERASRRDARFEPRPVTIVDAGWRRDLDLRGHLAARARTGPLPPARSGRRSSSELLDLVREHRSTIIFANNRRMVEKLTARLNEAGRWRDARDDPTGRRRSRPIRATSRRIRPFRAHHGSLSLEERRATEEALKQGELPAVVATASLELGIDMGAVDLVCQVESPGSVARGLQRVGRAGHVVGGVSKGRLIAKTPGDLLESAALCRAMLQGEVEHAPRPDAAASTSWPSRSSPAWRWSRGTCPALFDLVRGAYPFRDLPAEAFESVLRAGLRAGSRPPDLPRPARPGQLGPVHNRLPACPARRSWRWSAAGRSPTPVSSRSTWRRRARGWASSTRSSSTSGGWARRSCWATRPGGSRRSSPIASSSARPRGSRR